MSYRDKLRSILEIKDTPRAIALSFAIGVFWGMSPLLGIHTIGAFFMAWLMRLNKFVAIVGVCITNPWTFIPIYSFSLWIGTKMVGMEHIIPDIDWSNITFILLMKDLKDLIIPFFVGTFAVGTVSAIVSYIIIYAIVTRYRKREAAASGPQEG